MQLKYIGPQAKGGVLPLPEGWLAGDHDEPDEALAAEKVKSGNYQAEKPARAARDGA